MYLTKPRWLAALTLSGILAGLIWLWWQRPVLAPAATFTTITGKTIKPADLKNKATLITFWATTCAGCIAEIPDLIKLHQSFHASGLEIIAIAMYYDPPSHVIRLARSQHLPYEVVLDFQKRHAVDYGHVELTPTTFLIDRQGRIVSKITGKFSIKEMTAQIDNILISAST
jgi:peroxiredoxin